MNDEIMQILTQQSKAIGRIEAHLKTLVGNGSPGKITKMEDEINSLKETRSNTKGYIAGFGGALILGEGLFHYLISRFK